MIHGIRAHALQIHGTKIHGTPIKGAEIRGIFRIDPESDVYLINMEIRTGCPGVGFRTHLT